MYCTKNYKKYLNETDRRKYLNKGRVDGRTDGNFKTQTYECTKNTVLVRSKKSKIRKRTSYQKKGPYVQICFSVPYKFTILS